MNNYKLYRGHVQITNVDMVKAVKESFPGFSKIAASMVNNPYQYGVCLCPEAEKKLVSVFGEGPGLASIAYIGELEVKPAPKKAARRHRARQLNVRLTDEVMDLAKELKEQSGYATMTDFLEALLRDYAERVGNGKHLPKEAGHEEVRPQETAD